LAVKKGKAGKSNRGRQEELKALPVEYHVVPNGERWDVERDDTFVGSFAYDVHTAIGLATAAAQRDHHNGLDVMVCVQEPSGNCRKAWP
jgi:hypothetical protein